MKRFFASLIAALVIFGAGPNLGALKHYNLGLAGPINPAPIYPIGKQYSGKVEDRAAVALALKSSVVLVSKMDDRAYCSGTLVNPDIVLTAAHCVHKFIKESTVIELYGGERVAIERVERIRKGMDLALLRLEKRTNGRVVNISTDIAVSDLTIMVGAPDGEKFMVYFGRIGKILESSLGYCQSEETGLGSENQKLILLDSNGWFGNSGGGIFDYRGNLIGVLSGGAIADSSCESAVPPIGHLVLAIAVSGESVEKFLSEPGDK